MLTSLQAIFSSQLQTSTDNLHYTTARDMPSPWMQLSVPERTSPVFTGSITGIFPHKNCYKHRSTTNIGSVQLTNKVCLEDDHKTMWANLFSFHTMHRYICIPCRYRKLVASQTNNYKPYLHIQSSLSSLQESIIPHHASIKKFLFYLCTM